MTTRLWNVIMNSEQNPLMRLPKTVRFQLMVVLSSLWSIIFCASVGIMLWLPGYIVAHVVLLFFGIFGTAWIFRAHGRT